MVVERHVGMRVPAAAGLPPLFVAVAGEVRRAAHRPDVGDAPGGDPGVDPVPARARGVDQPGVDPALVAAVGEEHRLDLDHHPTGPVGAGRALGGAEQALRAGVGGEQLGRAAAERVPDQVRRVSGAGAGEVVHQVLVGAPVLGRGGGGVAVPGDVRDGLRRVLLVGRRVVAEVVDVGTGKPQVGHCGLLRTA